MGQAIKDEVSEIESTLRAAQASISLATELLSKTRALSNGSAVEIYKLDKQMRHMRNRLFPDGYFADVAWDVMVDLFLADSEHRKLSIADLSDRNEVPLSTLLRYIAKMEADGLLYRIPDHHDKRRVFIKLTAVAIEKLKNVAECTKMGPMPSLTAPLFCQKIGP